MARTPAEILASLKEPPQTPTPTPKAAKGDKAPEPTPAEIVGLSTSTLAFRRKVKKRHLLNDAGVGKAIEQIKFLPAEGESLHCIMGGRLPRAGPHPRRKAHGRGSH